MRENVLQAIHFMHAGRDTMSQIASDVWWPKIYRETVEKARNCAECQKAGKNFKCVKSQNEFGKILEAKNPNDEFSLDFAGPVQNAYKQKKYFLVSVDNVSGWPAAMNISADKVVKLFIRILRNERNFKKDLIRRGNSIYGTNISQQFCMERFIQHLICPMRDHRDNEKVERMIRTVNEGHETNRKRVVQKETSGLSN